MKETCCSTVLTMVFLYQIREKYFHHWSLATQSDPKELSECIHGENKANEGSILKQGN